MFCGSGPVFRLFPNLLQSCRISVKSNSGAVLANDQYCSYQLGIAIVRTQTFRQIAPTEEVETSPGAVVLLSEFEDKGNVIIGQVTMTGW